jgi:hypothetical protein
MPEWNGHTIVRRYGLRPVTRGQVRVGRVPDTRPKCRYAGFFDANFERVWLGYLLSDVF